MSASAVVTSSAPQQPTSRRARRRTPRRRGPGVRVLEATAGSKSVVEVTAPKADNPLYRAFRALRALGVQIVHAEVRAVSDGMIQRFHLLECDGRSLNPDRLSEVLVALSSGSARPLRLSDRLARAPLCA